MAELTKEQRDKLIELCKQRVIADGLADVRDVAHGHGTEIGCDGIDFLESKRVAHILCAEDPRYDLQEVREESCFITLNRNYKFEQSIRRTNENIRHTNNSIRSLNVYQKFTLGISVAIAALTTVFIILTYRLQRDESSQTELKDTKTQVQEISKSMQDIHTSLKEINASIEKLKMDSLSVHVKK